MRHGSAGVEHSTHYPMNDSSNPADDRTSEEKVQSCPIFKKYVVS